MNNEKNPSLAHLIGCVEEFHNAFRIPVRKTPTGELEEREYTLRFNLMKEENEEYLEAAQNGRFARANGRDLRRDSAKQHEQARR